MPEPQFILGTVSNCWSALLASSSLEEQCQRSLQAGYGYVELRQRALGSCEELVADDARPWPLPAALARLAAAFPQLGFNLAVEAPFFTTPVDAGDPYLRRCALAAVSLGGQRVLRLVDLSPAPTLLTKSELTTLGDSVAALTEALWRDGVRLALENSKQPVAALSWIVRHAAARLPEGTPAPRICWDPHNQIAQTLAVEDPVATAGELPLDSLFEFHFKQAREGVLQTDVAAGDLDWPTLVQRLAARGYQGPALHEIPTGLDIWERLERSTAYVRSLLLTD